MVTAARTVSQMSLHMGVAFAIMYFTTGSVAFGGLAAIVEPACNVMLMPLHDKLWEKIKEKMEAGSTQTILTKFTLPIFSLQKVISALTAKSKFATVNVVSGQSH